MGLVGSARAGVQNYVRMMGSLGKAFRTVNLNIGAFRNLNLKNGEEADFSSFGSLPWRDDCRNEVNGKRTPPTGRVEEPSVTLR